MNNADFFPEIKSIEDEEGRMNPEDEDICACEKKKNKKNLLRED